MSDATGLVLALLSWSMAMSVSPAAKGRLFPLSRRLAQSPTSSAVHEGVTEGETIAPETSIARALREWAVFQARPAVEGVQALPEWIE